MDEDEEPEDESWKGDAAYERWRDDCVWELEKAVAELHAKFVKAKHNYYTDRMDIFKQDVLDMLGDMETMPLIDQLMLRVDVPQESEDGRIDKRD